MVQYQIYIFFYTIHLTHYKHTTFLAERTKTTGAASGSWISTIVQLFEIFRVPRMVDLCSCVYFQNLVRGEIVYQNQRINENLEDIIVKDVNQHLYSTHTKYEQKHNNTKVVWCMHSNPSSKPRVGPAYGGKHFHSWQIFLFQRITSQTTPFALKFGGVQLEKYTKQKEVVGWVYMC